MSNLFPWQKSEQNKKNDYEPQKKRSYQSSDLFQGDREIVILHGDSQYRLQITKAGKLILNK